MSISKQQNTNFRPDINGLRAVAVVSVLLFHFKVPFFTGGFIGVDVFFVISGFLMTQLITSGLDKGTFNFAQFYINRMARIVPALLVLSFVYLVSGYYLLPPVQYWQLAQEIIDALTFTINIFYSSDTGYFSPVATERWLLHCWSLAVEFQFYIVFPVFLYCAKRLSLKNGILCSLLLAICISMICSFLQTNSSPVKAFYLLPSRAWEFAIGGVILFLPTIPSKYRNIVALLGLVAIVSTLFLFSNQLIYPSLWAVIPVAGSVMVIWARSDFFGLTNPLAQFTGKISYSLYLWHWVLISLSQYFGYGNQPQEIILLVTFTLVISWISFSLIEIPFRDMFRNSRLNKLGYFLVAIMLVLIACIAVVSTKGLPSRLSDNVFDVMQRSTYKGEFRDGTCFLRPEQKFSDIDKKCLDLTPLSKKPKLVIWGSSHAAHLYSGIAIQPWADQFDILQLTASACPPLPVSVDPLRPNCAEIQKSFRAVVKRAKPEILILAIPRILLSDSEMSSVPSHVLTSTGLQEFIRTLKQDGVGKIIIIGPPVEWTLPLPQIFFRDIFMKNSFFENMSIPLDPDGFARIDQKYKSAIDLTNAQYLSMRDLLCKGVRCLTLVPNWPSNVLFQFDKAHLTGDGSKWIAENLIGPALGMPTLKEPFAPLNQIIEFNSNALGQKFLNSGWMPPEAWGTWGADPTRPSVINLSIDPMRMPSAVKIEFQGLLSASLPIEHFNIEINGDKSIQVEVTQAKPINEQVFVISDNARNVMAEHHHLRIQFRGAEGKSPKSMGINDDTRILGFGIRKLTLMH